MEIWTISRRVVPSVPGAPNFAVGFIAAMGDAAQVPTQWVLDSAAAMTELKQRASKKSGNVSVFLGINRPLSQFC